MKLLKNNIKMILDEKMLQYDDCIVMMLNNYSVKKKNEFWKLAEKTNTKWNMEEYKEDRIIIFRKIK